MKVVIDTNVLVSAILKNRLPEEVVFYVIENSQCQWIASSEILAEYKDVLSRPKFKLPLDILTRWFAIFDRHITMTKVNLAIDFPRDQKDAKFLACAIEYQADIFISGDKDFSDAQMLVTNTQIMSIAAFYNQFAM
jgi:putative PIN family toxin of toxin-antitoxin system